MGGMPVIEESVEAEIGGKSAKMLIMFGVIPRLIALGIAFCICKFGKTDNYNKVIDNVGYIYLAAFLFSITVWFLNMFPASRFKPLVMGGDAGNFRVNMNIKVNAVDGAPNQPYVVLEDQGSIGMYNRANRSLTNFVENVPSFMLNWLLTAVIMPFPAFVLMAIFCLGRILHMTGYAFGGYGKHGPGFILSALIAASPMEMLVLIIGLKMAFDVSIGL